MPRLKKDLVITQCRHNRLRTPPLHCATDNRGAGEAEGEVRE